MQKRKKKICFAASSGGHYEQLLMLRPLMEQYDSFILTERTEYVIQESVQTYYLTQINRREKMSIPKLLHNAFRSLYIFCKERPDVIICTGVLAMVPMCLLMKLLGRKLIYIESFAMVSSATKTGRLLYHFADQFYVQWETMQAVYPKAIYLGGIY